MARDLVATFEKVAALANEYDEVSRLYDEDSNNPQHEARLRRSVSALKNLLDPRQRDVTREVRRASRPSPEFGG